MLPLEPVGAASVVVMLCAPAGLTGAAESEIAQIAKLDSKARIVPPADSDGGSVALFSPSHRNVQELFAVVVKETALGLTDAGLYTCAALSGCELVPAPEYDATPA